MDVGWEPLLENVTLFCYKNDTQILDLKDAYYNGKNRQRGSHVSNLCLYEVDLFIAFCDKYIKDSFSL